MFDFATAMQVALSPAVTITVIGLLVAVIVGIWFDDTRRLKAQAAKIGKENATLVLKLILAAEKEMKKRVAVARSKAIIETLATLDKFGASDELLFGARHPFRARKDREADPFNTFTLKELLDTIGGFKPRHRDYNPETVGGGSGLARGESPSVDDYMADIKSGYDGSVGAKHGSGGVVDEAHGTASYSHNAGPLEAAAESGRTHADVQDGCKGDGGTKADGGTTLHHSGIYGHSGYSGQSPRAG